MSYLNEHNLEGTSVLRDNNFLAPIPEDRSNTPNDLSTSRRDSNADANPSRRTSRWWETRSTAASSTYGVVDDLENSQERPQPTPPRSPPSERKLACSWKMLSVLVILMVVVGVGIYFVVDNVGKNGGNKDSPQNTIETTEPPSLLAPSIMPSPATDDFLPTDSPTFSPSITMTGEMLELMGIFEQLMGSNITVGTPEFKAVLWYLTDPGKVRVATHGLQRVVQRFILVSLYFSWGGENWVNQNYATPDSECDWHGVYCDNNSTVGIRIQSNNLVGQLPESLSQLSNLVWILLRNNSLTG